MHVAGSSGKKGSRKSLNFELNLVPFIDMLSVCICFLLVTAVFINLGSFHVSQAIGSEASSSEEKPKGSVTASLGDRGEIRFEVKDVQNIAKSERMITIAGDGGKLNLELARRWIEAFAAKHSDVKTVLILPHPGSKYDDLMQLMAQFRRSSLDQIGIAPL
ncbi:MAG: ExbD/TolR family protein [Bdellovibrionales bacterium]